MTQFVPTQQDAILMAAHYVAIHQEVFAAAVAEYEAAGFTAPSYLTERAQRALHSATHDAARPEVSVLFGQVALDIINAAGHDVYDQDSDDDGFTVEVYASGDSKTFADRLARFIGLR